MNARERFDVICFLERFQPDPWQIERLLQIMRDKQVLPPHPLVEVRCCCDAHLIGWLPLIGFWPERGRTYDYPILKTLSVADLLAHRDAEVDITLSFDCDLVGTKPLDSHLALKSRDYPIEQLRRIPGFVDASGPS